MPIYKIPGNQVFVAYEDVIWGISTGRLWFKSTTGLKGEQ